MYKWLADKYDIEIDENINSNIQTTIKNEAMALLKNSSQSKPPFCYSEGEKIRIHKIRKIYDLQYLDIKKEGMLVPYKKGFKLYLSNRYKNTKRERINWGHEIGHSFFYNISKQPPSKEYSTKDNKYWVEEDLAYIFARELIIPRKNLMLRRMHKTSPTIYKLNELVDVYKITKNSLVKKLIIDEKFWDVYLGLFSMKKNILNKEWVYRGKTIKINPNTKDILSIIERFTNNDYNKTSIKTIDSNINNKKYSIGLEIKANQYITVLIKKTTDEKDTSIRKLESFIINEY